MKYCEYRFLQYPYILLRTISHRNSIFASRPLVLWLRPEWRCKTRLKRTTAPPWYDSKLLVSTTVLFHVARHLAYSQKHLVPFQISDLGTGQKGVNVCE